MARRNARSSPSVRPATDPCPRRTAAIERLESASSPLNTVYICTRCADDVRTQLPLIPRMPTRGTWRIHTAASQRIREMPPTRGFRVYDSDRNGTGIINVYKLRSG